MKTFNIPGTQPGRVLCYEENPFFKIRCINTNYDVNVKKIRDLATAFPAMTLF